MVEQTAIPQGDAGKVSDAELYAEIAAYMGWEDDAPPKATEEPTPEEPKEELEAETPKEDEETEQEEAVAEEKKEETTDEKWFPESLSELAEALEVDQDALKAIKIHTKVDGVEADVPLGEVIKNYQLNKSLTERSEALAQARKAIEQQAQAYTADYQSKVEELGTWQGILEQRLREQVAAVDWQQLREDDPAEYAARRQEFTERIAEIESMKASIGQHRQALQAQQQQAYLNQIEQVVQENIKKLPDLIPEYKDETFRKKDMADLKDYLVSQGFSEVEVKTVFDARQVAIARKAKLYDAMQKAAEPKMKQLKEKPKFIKPNAQNRVEDKATKESDRLYKRALKNQTIDAWVDVLANRL